MRRLLVRLFAVSLAAASLAAQSPDLSADVRIYDAASIHNAYPDECDMRLQRLYIAQDLELAIDVQFSRELSEEESQQVQWQVSDGAAQPASGDFVGLGNPAHITTTVTADAERGAHEAVVRITYQGTDLTPPLPLRVISNVEYDRAYATLAAITDGEARLPLTTDLLARFLGQERTDAGVPTVGAEPLNICDPRLTQRAGADWGSDTVTDVPLVQYGPDQPAASVVAEGVARALLAEHGDEVRNYFASNPSAQTHEFEYTYSGNLTLNVPVDAALALHGVQFEGTVSATIDAPTGPRARLAARDIVVRGTVGDLYDFDIEASGAGAAPAVEAAKLEISSANHDIGKVFVVQFSLDSSIPSLEIG